jgi:hypothetical protein
MAESAASLQINSGDHLCVLHDGDAERDQVLGLYLKDGITAGDKCLFGAHDASRSVFRSRIGPAGEVDSALSSGQLDIRTAHDQLVSPGQFSFTKLIALWKDFTTTALDEGYRFVRLGAEARWWTPQIPDVDAFIQYESELNRFVPQYPQAVLCLYDVRKIDGAFIMNAIRVHPRVMLYGLVCENPYFLTPDEFSDRTKRS